MAIFTAIGTAVLGSAAATAAAGTAFATGLGLVSAGVGAAATVQSLKAQKKSIAFQQQATQSRIKMQQQEAMRERRRGIRTAMIQKAQMRAQAEAMGTSQTSGFAGGTTSVSSQIGSNLGFGSMMSGLGQQYTSLTGQAADAQSRAQLFGTMGNMFSGFSSSLGGFDFMQLFQPNLSKSYVPGFSFTGDTSTVYGSGR